MREWLYGFVRFGPDRWHLSLAGGVLVMRAGPSVELKVGRWYLWVSRRD